MNLPETQRKFLGSGMVWDGLGATKMRDSQPNQPNHQLPMSTVALHTLLHIADLGPSEGQEDEATNVLAMDQLQGLELIIPGMKTSDTGKSQFD
jgi:hypothetical protein